MGSLDWVAVPAGHADIDWDRLSSLYRLCLADAQSSGQLSGVPSTIRISQATWARLTFILGFIYGVLDYDVRSAKRAIICSPLRRGTYPTTIRCTGAFYARCTPPCESQKYRCHTVLTLRHDVLIMPPSVTCRTLYHGVSDPADDSADPACGPGIDETEFVENILDELARIVPACVARYRA